MFSVPHSKENLMNTTTRFHLTAAAFGVLIASSAYAETNQVYSYTVQAHNAPMTVDVIMKDGKIANILTDNRESPGVGKLAIANLSKKIIRNQTINVDNVTGASVTSMALKYAVKKNLEAAGADLSKFQDKLPKAQLKDSYNSEVVIIGGGGAGRRYRGPDEDIGSLYIQLLRQSLKPAEQRSLLKNLDI